MIDEKSDTRTTSTSNESAEREKEAHPPLNSSILTFYQTACGYSFITNILAIKYYVYKSLIQNKP